MASNTTRSLKKLRNNGWTAEVVEKWNPHAKIRQDLFGFIDILAVKDGRTIGVQTTSAAHVSDRAKKIREHENLEVVLAAGWTVRVDGWQKVKNRWVLKRQVVIKSSAKAIHGDEEEE